jgi:hypothetical protein
MSLRRKVAASLCAGLLLAAPLLAAAQAEAKRVIVNGEALRPDAVQALERAYKVPIAPGRYWYDKVSGAWGLEGGPISGQMAAGLPLGGPLRSEASRGASKVFINGRELTAGEVEGLQNLCRTPVIAGRYWVNAQGVGGVEGRPATFDLAACAPRRSGGSSTRTYCDTQGNCSSHGLWGWVSTTR